MTTKEVKTRKKSRTDATVRKGIKENLVQKEVKLKI